MARLASLPLHCYSTEFPYKGGQVIIIITVMSKWCNVIVIVVALWRLLIKFYWSLLSFFLSLCKYTYLCMILCTFDISKVLLSEEDLKLPKELHPIFYGCFDWHRSIGSMLCFQFYVLAHALTPQKNCHLSIKPSTAPSMDIGCWPEQLLCFQVCFPNRFVL